jgi:hypothetical protein
VRSSHHAGESFPLQGNFIHITAFPCHHERLSPMANSAVGEFKFRYCSVFDALDLEFPSIDEAQAHVSSSG